MPPAEDTSGPVAGQMSRLAVASSPRPHSPAVEAELPRPTPESPAADKDLSTKPSADESLGQAVGQTMRLEEASSPPTDIAPSPEPSPTLTGSEYLDLHADLYPEQHHEKTDEANTLLHETPALIAEATSGAGLVPQAPSKGTTEETIQDVQNQIDKAREEAQAATEDADRMTFSATVTEAANRASQPTSSGLEN